MNKDELHKMCTKIFQQQDFNNRLKKFYPRYIWLDISQMSFPTLYWINLKSKSYKHLGLCEVDSLYLHNNFYCTKQFKFNDPKTNTKITKLISKYDEFYTQEQYNTTLIEMLNGDH